MGRTRRKRRRKLSIGNSLHNEEDLIILSKWMKNCGWRNQTSLRLRNFQITGRGVYSKQKLSAGNTLIQVPYKLLITITTIQESELLNILNLSEGTKLKFQDLLCLYLIAEKLKSSDSKWWPYIKSLPQEPPWLPMKLPYEDIEKLPDDIKKAVSCSRWNIEESLARLRKSINCRNEYQRCVLDVNLFTWAFTMVNTRAVYVDPGIIQDLSEFPVRDLRRFLSDEPCMALCPFLDMFNHSCNAKTTAALKKYNNGWFYELNTLCSYNKYEQIFISYGSHDNLKLFCEYGFFIPFKNMMDTIKFSVHDVLNYLETQVSSKLMRFLLERNLDKDLYVGFDGISFNLKALFYLLLQNDLNIWSTCVFSGNYSEETLEKFRLYAIKILQNRLQSAKRALCAIENSHLSKHPILLGYLKYNAELMQHFCKVYEK